MTSPRVSTTQYLGLTIDAAATSGTAVQVDGHLWDDGAASGA